MLTCEALDDVAMVTCEGIDEVAMAAGEVHVFVGQAPRAGTSPDGVRPGHDHWALLPLLLHQPEHRLKIATQSCARPTQAGADLFLDAAHDGDLLLVAVSRGCPIGAGLQDGLAAADEYALATLSPAERRQIEQAPAGQRSRLLTQLWVRKDAVLRLSGGRAAATTQLDVTLPAGHGPVTLPTGFGDPARCPAHVHDVALRPGAYAAVAVTEEPREVHVWAVDYGNAIANQPSAEVAGATPLAMNSVSSRQARAAGR